MIKIRDDIKKKIAKTDYYDVDNFILDAKEYIKAIESGRCRYEVVSVSKSGMRRTINISAFVGKYSNGYFRTFRMMLKHMGYSFDKYDDLIVTGCGMNMLFATNYNIVHELYRMGFMKKEKCDKLAQKIN